MALKDKNFSDIFTYSRASRATAFDPSGILLDYAHDNLRQGFDQITGAPLGWHLEGSTTNYSTNSRCEGAVPGSYPAVGTYPSRWFASNLPLTNAGIETIIIGNIVVNGLPGVRVRYTSNGVPTTASGSLAVEFAPRQLGATGSIPATAGQIWSTSVFLALSGGSMTGLDSFRLTQSEYETGGVRVNGSQINGPHITLDATPRRYTLVAPPTAGTTTLTVGTGILGTFSSGQVVDITIDFLCPQVEMNYCVTTPVLAPVGTLGTVTRATDNLSIRDDAFATIFGPGAPTGYLIVDVLFNQAAGTAHQIPVEFGGGTGRIHIGNRSNSQNLFLWGSLAPAATGATASMTPGKVVRLGLMWNPATTTLCADNGGFVRFTGGMPAGTNSVRFGAQLAGGAPINGQILGIWAGSVVLDDAKFAAACAPGANIESILS